MSDLDLDFREVVMGTTDGVLVVDAGGIIRFANPAAATILAREVAELVDAPFGTAVVSDETTEIDVPRPDGQVEVVHLTRTLIRWHDRPAELVTLRDVTKGALAERQLAASEERYALSVRGANDGLWDWDLDTGAFYTSPRCAEMLGYAPQELEGKDANWWLGQIHPDDAASMWEAFERHLAGATELFATEVRYRQRDGSWAWVLVRGLTVREEDRPRRFTGSMSDVTARRKAEDELRRLALHDSLTGLANRTLLVDRLGNALGRARRKSERFAVLFLDLDRFKAVNDALGHAAGDALLVAVADRLQGCVRNTDTVARLGGDEFAVLLGEPLPGDALRLVVGRIREALDAPIHIDGHAVRIQASIGVVVGDQRSPSDEEQVLHRADLAMYRAKQTRRGSVEIWDAAVDTGALGRLHSGGWLTPTVRRKDLFVRYQPVVELAKDRVIGFESLLRWRAEADLVLDAEAFLDAAAVAGSPLPFGWEALTTACRQIRSWRDGGHDVWISVNLSARQVAVEDLSTRVATALAEAGIEGSALQLEIPEQSLALSPTNGVPQLARCRDLGVGVVIDDFGLDHLPLSALAGLPVTAVKIDRSIVGRLGHDVALDPAIGLDRGIRHVASSPEPGEHDERRAIATVRAILAVADALGLQVVAEGIETQAQRDVLVRLGCTLGQGFIFAPALDSEIATDVLARGLVESPDRSPLREPGRHLGPPITGTAVPARRGDEPSEVEG